MPQVKSNNVWPEEVVFGPSMGILNPGQSATFVATGLTNKSSWRVPVIWGRWNAALEVWFQAREWLAERLDSAPPTASVRTNFIEAIAP
jgi:hypothetical protein